MILSSNFKEIVLSFSETKEAPHRNMLCYKVKGKIFVTHNQKENRCCVKLSLKEQLLFCMIDASIIYAVPNGFGKYGWTLVNLKSIEKDLLIEVLTAAYCNVAPFKLSQSYLTQIESF